MRNISAQSDQKMLAIRDFIRNYSDNDTAKQSFFVLCAAIFARVQILQIISHETIF